MNLFTSNIKTFPIYLTLVSLLISYTQCLQGKFSISKRIQTTCTYAQHNSEFFSKFSKDFIDKKTILTSIISGMLLTSGLPLLPIPAAAAATGWGLFSSTEQRQIDEIASYQSPINELLENLRPTDIPNAIGVYSKSQLLKGGVEDSAVVENYLQVYILPLQKKMQDLAPKLGLEESDQKKMETFPLLMKGHDLELEQAIKSMKADEQAREVEEIQETLADFLRTASTKYSVEPFRPSRPISDKELFGPLGCEFWGKKRVEGSNACADNK